MKTTITLNGSEIRVACSRYLKNKYPKMEIEYHDLKTARTVADPFLPVIDDLIQYVVALKDDTTLESGHDS